MVREKEKGVAMPAIYTRIRFQPDISQEEGMYTAICMELGLAACADTEEEARAKLQQAIISYCNALKRGNLLEKALKESNIMWEPLEIDAEPNEMIVDVA